ncbi:hypothetical protein M405DRAFT_829577 [Rhizopogon salebrosus TDB-379]|nr:hypothetical protein M405DRAFT_829575 [Rhizopogon salebrosus TDB-379]KAJ8583039.1 hypothetical protein M405DRAFT_829577 [Rhizopogon salebrosus TDB-379]
MLNRKYSPGDSTLIHPFAALLEVDSFLVTMYQTFPDHVPNIVSLRILFACYLDFNAVPRRSFCQLL